METLPVVVSAQFWSNPELTVLLKGNVNDQRCLTATDISVVNLWLNWHSIEQVYYDPSEVDPEKYQQDVAYLNAKGIDVIEWNGNVTELIQTLKATRNSV